MLNRCDDEVYINILRTGMTLKGHHPVTSNQYHSSAKGMITRDSVLIINNRTENTMHQIIINDVFMC